MKKETAKGGSRLKKQEKKRRLTKQQKSLVALAVVLAVAVTGVLAWRSVFVRPSVGGGGFSSSSPFGWNPIRRTAEKTGEAEEIDYGPGIRPRSEGTRKSEDFYTVLILGRDTGGGGNTDTMLLASYDVTNQEATVMSIPRDTMVNVSWDVKKINSVYNAYGGGERGVQAVYKEVAQLVGFEPDFRVVVEWEAVGKIVDAIGGVWFDVEYHMDYHDPTQNLVIEQIKGHRLLTGDDAMQVIRWRANDNDSPFGYRKKDGGIGDSGRMELQQQFLKAVFQQMLTIQNVGNLGKISKVFQENVETDLSFQNILWFAQKAFMGGLKTENVEFLTMPWKGTYAWSRTYKQNLDYVVPQARQLLEIVNSRLSPFQETFTLSDLDIMSVNRDGSLSSSAGYVEDRKAASPPVIPKKEEPEDVPPVDESGDPPPAGSGEPAGKGGGAEGGTVVIDLQTGGSAAGGEGADPGTGAEPGTFTDPADPGTVPDPGTEPEEGTGLAGGETVPAPAEPAFTEPPADPGFALVEQPPEE